MATNFISYYFLLVGSKKSKMSMGGRAKVPMFTWSTFVRSGATLNLDRPAENEARAWNKTLGDPTWPYASSSLPHGGWVTHPKGRHPRGAVPAVERGAILARRLLLTTNTQSAVLGSSMTPGSFLCWAITILTRFKTSSTPILYSSVQRLEWSCDNSVKHLLPSTHFHTHTRSAAELQQVKGA